jgi:hypothetical protein
MSFVLPPISVLTTPIAIAAGALALITQSQTFLARGQARYRELDERTKAVTFWKTWIEAQKLMALEADLPDTLAPARRALLDLGLAPGPRAPPRGPDDRVGPPNGPARNAADSPRQHSLVRSIFLLTAPRRPWVWGLQVLFYAGLLAAVGTVGGGVLALADDPSGANLVSFSVLAIAVLLVVAVLRQVVLVFDQPRRPARETPP